MVRDMRHDPRGQGRASNMAGKNAKETRLAQSGGAQYKQLKLTDSQFENAKINPKGSGCKQVKNAKLWNPDVVGMTILIMVVCFTIYHITVYVDSWQ